MGDASEIFWTAGFLNERFPAPVSPLGWSLVGPLFEEIALRDPLRYMGYRGADTIPGTRLRHGHPYSNVLIFQIIYNPFPALLVPADAVRFFPNGDTMWRERAPYPRSLFNPRFLLSLFWYCLRDPINVSPFNFWQWSRYTFLHDRRVREMHTRLDQAKEPREILAVIARANQADRDLLKIHRWSLTYADIFYKLLTLLAGDAAQVLISDVPNLTHRVNADLQALVQHAAASGTPISSPQDLARVINAEFAEALETFLRAHGHRSFSLDIAVPTFADDPARTFALVSADALLHTGTDWREARAELRARLKWWLKPVFDVVLPFARRYAVLREDQRYYWQKSLAVTRRAYLMLAELLRAENVLDTRDDIFYATQPEIAAHFAGTLAAADLRALIRARGEEWSHYREAYLESPARAYPAFLHGDAPMEGTPPGPRDEWQGRGVSPGHARGVARIILDARELGRVARGEILVAPATDPGWTPVFARLEGLVLERGGVLAHGAIVAREYHLPAVAGVSNITRELNDGDWIEVDGTRGVIRKISKP